MRKVRASTPAKASCWGEGHTGVSGALAQRSVPPSLPHPTDYALGKDCIMHGYMSKMGNPFLTQWQRRYFYLFPNRLEWRGEGEAPVSVCWGAQGTNPKEQALGMGAALSSTHTHTALTVLRPAAEPADHGGDSVGGGDTDQGAALSAAQDPWWQTVRPAMRRE